MPRDVCPRWIARDIPGGPHRRAEPRLSRSLGWTAGCRYRTLHRAAAVEGGISSTEVKKQGEDGLLSSDA